MGIYSEYLDKGWGFEELTAERKKQLGRISKIRGGRDVIVYAADLRKPRAPISIDYSDILPFVDQLQNLSGTAVDLILETPGGAGEVAEDIVRILRGKYKHVGVIVPGCAKSAGTLVAMAGDEILMGSMSALGPVDAQLSWQGKTFSAHALLEGIEKIKREVADSGALNRAYIPILQGVSPGELQNAENALNFAKVLVKKWLCEYKFKDWTTHSSDGRPVTDAEREERAADIADALCDHGQWLTHGRSLRIEDLESLRLQITDIEEHGELADAVQRYYTLLQMTLDTNIYKVFETLESQIYRVEAPAVNRPAKAAGNAAIIEVVCPNCQNAMRVQASLEPGIPLEAGCEPFPADDKLKCLQCGKISELGDIRRQIEMQSKKKVIV